MNLTRTRKLLVMLLSGAWLPATITCRPLDLSGVVHIVGDPYYDEVIVVDGYEPWYYDVGCCDWWDHDEIEIEYDD